MIVFVLTVMFTITSSITTFDKRLIQARKSGKIPSDDPMLPSWVAFILWLHYGIMIAILYLNWKYALALFFVGFIFEVTPVWETIGNILMSPFRPKSKHTPPHVPLPDDRADSS
jgi:hypothetical protein